MQFFTDPQREHEEHALPNAEVLYNGTGDDQVIVHEIGWYWWACFPGCLPDGEPNGPFKTQEEAIGDAQDDWQR